MSAGEVEPVANSLLLIVDRTSPQNKYGPFVAEVLRSEGVCGFRTAELTDVNEALLGESSVAILTRCSTPNKARDLLAKYVASGGQLIILASEAALEPLLGLSPTPAGILDGYFRLQLGQEVSRGLPAESMQFHGAARHWLPTGAEILASLYSDAISPNGFPALTLNRYGEGRVAAFTFDLGESIATTRQGNARCSYSKFDGANNGPRPGDLFGGGWMDVSKEHLPQADVLQALFAHLIQLLSPIPVPRVWYLPGLARGLLLLTGDGEASDPANFRAQIAAVEQYGGHITFYLKDDTKISAEQESEWRNRGHGFGLHPWAGPEPSIQLIQELWPRQEESFRTKFGHASRTLRSHWLQWCGYSQQPKLLAEVGVAMDTNYVSTRPSHGKFMTGSGRPVRFVGEDGEIIPVWQQATQLEDDVLLRTPNGTNPHTFNLTTREGVALVTQLLTASIDHHHTPIMMNVHPPFYSRFSGEWLNRTMAFAREAGVPIWCAEEWLAFVEARDAVRIEDSSHSDGRLTFHVQRTRGNADLSLCLPVFHRGKTLKALTRSGEPVEFVQMTIQERPTAFVSLDGDGFFEAEYR
jgi:hypothetical protein